MQHASSHHLIVEGIESNLCVPSSAAGHQCPRPTDLLSLLAQPVRAYPVLEQLAQPHKEPLAQPLRQASQSLLLGLSGPTFAPLMVHM